MRIRFAAPEIAQGVIGPGTHFRREAAKGRTCKRTRGRLRRRPPSQPAERAKLPFHPRLSPRPPCFPLRRSFVPLRNWRRSEPTSAAACPALLSPRPPRKSFPGLFRPPLSAPQPRARREKERGMAAAESRQFLHGRRPALRPTRLHR